MTRRDIITHNHNAARITAGALAAVSIIVAGLALVFIAEPEFKRQDLAMQEASVKW